VAPLGGASPALFRTDKHPFYRHSQAVFFLAEMSGMTVGRLAVMFNTRYNHYRGTNLAHFGYFESINDSDVAKGLFDAGSAWAHQEGVDGVIGPRGFGAADSGGILVEGFDQRPSLGYPYNPEYYDRLLISSGFEKETDWHSGYLPADYRLPDRLYRIADRVKTRRGLVIKHFKNKREIRRWLPKIMRVHERAFQGSYSYVPPTEAELNQILDGLTLIADPRTILLVLKEDDVVGFILAYPDVSDGLRRARGRIWPVGWIPILLDRLRTKWLNINGVGMLPEYQGLGGNALLYTTLLQAIHKTGYQHLDIVQVNEKNFMSRSDMETIGVRWTKTHRAYRLRF
jgi:hypothetical protein